MSHQFTDFLYTGSRLQRKRGGGSTQTVWRNLSQTVALYEPLKHPGGAGYIYRTVKIRIIAENIGIVRHSIGVVQVEILSAYSLVIIENVVYCRQQGDGPMVPCLGAFDDLSLVGVLINAY